MKGSNNSYYLHGHGYTTEDLERVASEVGGFDLSDFFRRYIRGVEVLPYEEALANVGLRLVKRPAGEAYNGGVSIDNEVPELVIVGNVRQNSAAEEAGIEHGDEILSLGGKTVTRQNWQRLLSRYKEGDRIPISLKRDRRTIARTLVLGPPERFEYVIEERSDATSEQKQLRSEWLRG